MIAVAAMPVFVRPTAVVTTGENGSDCKDYHSGARADRAKPPRSWFSARFHDPHPGYGRAAEQGRQSRLGSSRVVTLGKRSQKGTSGVVGSTTSVSPGEGVTCLAFCGPSEAEVTFAVENSSVVW